VVINGSSHSVTLAALPTSAGAARRQVRAWLDAVSWPAVLIDDVVSAVTEAVTNVVEHAYTRATPIRTIEMRFWIEHGIDGTRRARIHVRDHGRWRPPPTDPGFRGHGLKLMHALMDEVITQPSHGTRGGTVTVLLSPPAPAPD